VNELTFNLFDKVLSKTSNKLWLSYGSGVSNPKLSVAVTAPRPHLSFASQSQRMLRADRDILDEMTSERHQLLWSVVTADARIGLADQSI